MQVVVVKAVEIRSLPSAFAHGTERSLAKPPNLLQHAWNACGRSEENIHVAGGSQPILWIEIANLVVHRRGIHSRSNLLKPRRFRHRNRQPRIRLELTPVRQ